MINIKNRVESLLQAYLDQQYLIRVLGEDYSDTEKINEAILHDLIKYNDMKLGRRLIQLILTNRVNEQAISNLIREFDLEIIVLTETYDERTNQYKLNLLCKHLAKIFRDMIDNKKVKHTWFKEIDNIFKSLMRMYVSQRNLNFNKSLVDFLRDYDRVDIPLVRDEFMEKVRSGYYKL